MEVSTWSPARSQSDGKGSKDELIVTFDKGRTARILILPALFDEANKLRRFTLTVMRALDEMGIDSALPDWPGCNESLAALEAQTLEGWRADALQAAQSFGATHCLSIRAGALLAPTQLSGWQYAPLDGPKLLSAMLRARMIAAREAGQSETREDLLERGRAEGLTLAGWPLGAPLVRALESAALNAAPAQTVIDQSAVGGAGLWLRAEPDENTDQATALAQIVAQDLAGQTGEEA
ncbi:MAG: hypothetical protein AAF291_04605 [Pseudomonadota bacterium]